MTDLFAGTATYYARYRAGYPPELFTRVRADFQLDGSGRLLDLGCGTGEIAMSLHRDFDEVVGVDVSAEMIAEAERQAAAASAQNVQWLRMAAEEVSPALGRFRLITLGSAFHWMDRDAVLHGCLEVLEPGGGMVIVGTESIWSSDDELARRALSVVRKWLGEERRTRSGAFPAPTERHEQVLARHRFTGIDVQRIPWERIVDVDTVLGELYSTSFANRLLLGDNAEAFEHDLRQALLALDPSGRYVERLTCEYIRAYKA